MVVDTSAIIAILLQEPEAADFARSIEASATPLISAVSVVEAGIVLLRREGPEALADLDSLLAEGGFAVETVDGEQVRLALDAYTRFGKGRHRAKLNFGDCFAYALSRAVDQPLLFKGDDFSRTDVARA